MIQFYEHTETGYAMRTWENAKRAGLTAAFAVDFNSPGELLTRKAAYGKYKRLLVGAHLNEEALGCFIISTAEEMDRRKTDTLNIAGNSLHTLIKYGYDQSYADALMLNFLSQLNEQVFRLKVRSGGQRGFDEAALKAGDKLGLETICLAPKHWLFRNETGTDIMSESLFFKRFGYDVIDLL